MPSCCLEFKLLHEFRLYAYRVTEREGGGGLQQTLYNKLSLLASKLAMLIYSVFLKAINSWESEEASLPVSETLGHK